MLEMTRAPAGAHWRGLMRIWPTILALCTLAAHLGVSQSAESSDLSACSDFTIVIAMTNSPKDWRRLMSALEMWQTPGQQPCDAAIAPPGTSIPMEYRMPKDLCGLEIPPETPECRPQLMIYTSRFELSNSQMKEIVEHLGPSGACFADPNPATKKATNVFEGVSFHTANLSASEDAYPVGPSVMFYRLIEFLNKNSVSKYIFLFEPDLSAVYPGWTQILMALTPPRTEKFWVKGAQPRVPFAMNPLWWFHANGNAIYGTGDPEFVTFLKGVEKAWPRLAYDVALAVTLLPWEATPKSPISRANMIVFSDFITSYWGKISLVEARQRFPCSALLHGNKTTFSH